MAARPRPLLAGVAAVLGTLVLSGCQKPTPLTTVTAAGRSYAVQASGWCAQGSRPACKSFDRLVPEVRVRAGQVVGVDVDRAIARGEWVVTLEQPGGASSDQQRLFVARATNEHYASFSAPSQAQASGLKEVLLRVSVQRSETGRQDDRVGQWFYRLKLLS